MTEMNITGLSLNLLAAVVMFYFPPRMGSYDKGGRQVFTWMTDPRRGKWRIGTWQVRLAGIGPVVLFVGFALQLLAAIGSRQ
jgi:hypothetical protein